MKQGDTVSPLESNAVLEDVVSFRDQRLGYDLDGFKLTHCLYADEVFLLCI